MVGSVRYDRVPSSTRTWRAEPQRASNFPLLAERACSRETVIAKLNLLFCILEPAGGI